MDNRENVRKESKKAVLIIIPAYNEEKNIVPLLENWNSRRLHSLQMYWS